MSIKKEFEERIVTQKVCVKETTICDVCGKEIKGEHYTTVTGHYDWGTDSTESIEGEDVCSKECLQTIFDEYLKRSDNDFNSEYINISHRNEP